ncbi:ComF family protein [Kitasatospora sp. NBC_01266]|uniref:ComF family protein n=1 Tax=Kitasatospora sp. NBC_01266 TaxID=2903572 RepID=UPI002E31297F|nr:ComF family protein [Kitasatospora sp. NBC_01266]
MSALLLDLLLPTACAGCGEPGGDLCAACRALLDGLRGQPAGPDPAPPGLPPLYSCAVYRDPLRRLLIAHKERGALRLVGPLGAVLAEAVHAALAADQAVPTVQTGPAGRAAGRPVLLVPVPSARHAVRARGHDATRRLARAAARRLSRAGLPCRVAPVLRQHHRVADQAGLGAEQRQANLHQALSVPPLVRQALNGRQLILVDDLVTTGASLGEAARALRAAGAPPLAAATVAATARREQPPHTAAPHEPAPHDPTTSTPDEPGAHAGAPRAVHRRNRRRLPAWPPPGQPG